MNVPCSGVGRPLESLMIFWKLSQRCKRMQVDCIEFSKVHDDPSSEIIKTFVKRALHNAKGDKLFGAFSS
jgi:hypothetical protein